MPTPLESLVLDIVRAHPGQDLMQVSTRAEKPYKLVRRALAGLQTKKLVRVQSALDIGAFTHRFYPEADGKTRRRRTPRSTLRKTVETPAAPDA